MGKGCSNQGDQDRMPDGPGHDPGSGNDHTGRLENSSRDGSSCRSGVAPHVDCRASGSTGEGGRMMEDKNILEDFELKENEEISEETVEELTDNKGDDE